MLDLMARSGTRALVALVAAAGCGNDSSENTAGYALRSLNGAPLAATAGDAFAIRLVHVDEHGNEADVPADAVVMWSVPGVSRASSPGDRNAVNPLPPRASQATATLVVNDERADHAADLSGTLFLLDPGADGLSTLTTTATIFDPSFDPTLASVTVNAAFEGRCDAAWRCETRRRDLRRELRALPRERRATEPLRTRTGRSRSRARPTIFLRAA